MNASLQRRVRRRARDRCEYCQMPQSAFRVRFPIDHIIALQHRGATDAGNLALACINCNAHKGPNLAGIDPDTGELTRLFHPRRDIWTDHFEWRGAVLAGRTPIGRATIHVLAVNLPAIVAVRQSLIREGSLPE